jgi:hypothetical protein
MRVGIAGTSIVSPYMTIVARELRIASIFHDSLEILFPEGGGNVTCFDGSGGIDLFVLAFL